MLHFEQRNFNRASSIALGHLLTAADTFKGIWGADEIDGPDLVTFTWQRSNKEIRLKWEKTSRRRKEKLCAHRTNTGERA